MTAEIRPLSGADAPAHRAALAEILAECVAGGASIGFMDGVTRADCAAWWDGVLADLRAGRVALFGAFVGGELAGSVQLGFSAMPNGRFRGEVRKLIVRRSARGRGAATALMGALEADARARGLRTLVLDTGTGSDAERLYRRLGWTVCGPIPDYALWPDGSPCETTVFWKAL